MKRLKRLIETASVIEWTSLDFHRDNAQDKFPHIWEDIRNVLDAVVRLRITGRKTDKRLKKLIKLGDVIYEGDFEKFPEFIAKLRKRWSPIRAIISMSIWVAKLVDTQRGERASFVMTQFIEIGDWLTGAVVTK